jgi:hypothetical protein
MARRYDNKLPGWQMRPDDRHYVGDFDGDGKADLYVFNGENWSIAYLGMFRSLGMSLCLVERFDGNVPGWQMRRHDQHWIADINRDGRSDLFVYNHADWGPNTWAPWLPAAVGFRVVGGGLGGEWNLGSVDQFEVCDFEGRAVSGTCSFTTSTVRDDRATPG